MRQSDCRGIRLLFVETISPLKWIIVGIESFTANTIGGGHSWTSELRSLFSRSDHRSSSGFSHCLHTVWSYLSEIGSTLVIVHYRQNVLLCNHFHLRLQWKYGSALVNGLTYNFNWQPLRISRGICLCVFCFLSRHFSAVNPLSSGLCQFLIRMHCLTMCHADEQRKSCAVILLRQDGNTPSTPPASYCLMERLKPIQTEIHSLPPSWLMLCPPDR